MAQRIPKFKEQYIYRLYIKVRYTSAHTWAELPTCQLPSFSSTSPLSSLRTPSNLKLFTHFLCLSHLAIFLTLFETSSEILDHHPPLLSNSRGNRHSYCWVMVPGLISFVVDSNGVCFVLGILFPSL